MRRILAAAVVVGVWAVSALAQNYIFSNTGTNYYATVYPPGYTNNAAYVVISTNHLGALPIKVRVSNVGTTDVVLVKGTTANTDGTVITNPVAGVVLNVGTAITLSEYPIIDKKHVSAVTDMVSSFGIIHVEIDKP